MPFPARPAGLGRLLGRDRRLRRLLHPGAPVGAARAVAGRVAERRDRPAAAGRSRHDPDPGPEAGRLAAAVLPAAALVDRAVRQRRPHRAGAVVRAEPAVHPAAVLARQAGDRPARRLGRGARVHHLAVRRVLRERDPDVQPAPAAGAARRACPGAHAAGADLVERPLPGRRRRRGCHDPLLVAVLARHRGRLPDRRGDLGQPGAQARLPVLAASASSAARMLFIPWFPTFLYQSKHTGTPWGQPPPYSAVVHAFGQWAGGQLTPAAPCWSSSARCWRCPCSATQPGRARCSST